ncbi:Mediator of RNA polymerase II transcription subunit 16 [Didymosphaeria variabile]|uniref:Mediator of RNA polymerase II transcription subunit 16 n=1 Tax=Didymosphaeria variabile TaxID=1932322 RepID=A0A9W8XK97_9PLEO|nr:Mediator of RNA polymerase II transcription subunit 16 [Didymosphaeria variabile]KAJ4353410.1 Mediator of RNA polymerase II transcription subunit 16 [Didymosphaeria variabile]
MDVDDLFGDSEQVALPPMNMTAAPPVKGLAKRLDELATSGCCSRIAWSKNGCLAYITPDGLGVNLRVFARVSSTETWDLGTDVQLDIPHHNEEFPLVHLSWSHLGNDLAVVNAAGHVLIFSCAMVLDRMNFTRTELAQSDNEIDAVVGMHWLAIYPYEQKNHIAWSASKSGEKWSFNITSQMFRDMHHAVDQKACLVYLMRKEAVWNIPPPAAGQAPPKVYEKPELQVTELATEDECHPAMIDSSGLPGGSESKVPVSAQLTHLDFLPITPEDGDGSVPTVQAIFVTPPNMITVDPTHPQPSPSSIVAKWEVHHSEQNQLHASLDKVTSKKKSVNSVPARTVWHLRRQADTMTQMNQVILSCVPLWYSMILAFCYSDGTIELKRRKTQETITPDYNTEEVTSMAQAGFTFPTLDSPLNVALSPNHCIAASLQHDGKINLHPTQYNFGSLAVNDKDQDQSASAALAALVLQHTTAANQYFCSDDIFSVMGQLSEDRKRDFILFMFQALNVKVDCGIVDDGTNQNHLILLGRSPFFVKTLSALHLLGLKDSVDRSLTSKLAWMVLNIKYVTQILTTIARMHGNIDKAAVRPEVVPQFIGICRWIMHFMVYLIDELLQIGHEFQSTPASLLTPAILQEKLASMNKPALLILLSSFPRMMMKLWANPIQWVQRTAYGYIQNNNSSPEMRKLYYPLHQALTEAPLDWRHFEHLISEAQHLVRSCYKQANCSADDRDAIERELLLGRIPAVLFPAARRLVTDTLFADPPQHGGQGTCLADKVDMAKILFFDTTWLGLTPSRRAATWFETHTVDVCQKMIIRGTGTHTHPIVSRDGQNGRGRSDSIQSVVPVEDGKRKKQLRKCVRCGAYMEDVMLGLPGYAQTHVSWLMGVAKHCVCGNSWMLAPETKRES